MKKALFIAPIIIGFVLVTPAFAGHTWSGYHWAHTSTPFTLKLGDNVSTSWDAHLAGASADWSLSNALDTSIVPGSTNPKNCRAVSGRVEVCNNKYGNTGWLGIASIWASGEHITQGTVKVNDTYFSTPKYNTPAWKNLVICQEIGHTFGLNHQDENFNNANIGTCMDYTNAPQGGIVGGFDYGPSNEHPNFHDYEELALIYAHNDTFSTVSSASTKGGVAQAVQEGDFTNASEWGKAIGKDAKGRDNEFVRDLGNGTSIMTHVFWAE